MLLIVLGQGLWHTWRQALNPESDFWRNFDDIEDVLQLDSIDFPLSLISKRYSRTVILPLTVNDYLNCPAGYDTLISSKETISTLNNKRLFKEFMTRNNLTDFIPRTLDPNSFLIAPFMMKRTDLLGGLGVMKIDGENHFNWAQEFHRFKGFDYILEEFIPGDTEYVTHLMCRNGRILWSATFEGPVPEETNVNMGAFAKNLSRISSDDFDVYKEIVELSNYSGPASINFKLRNELPTILDFNPRFGGSLFMDCFRTFLRESVQTYLNHAYLS